MKRAADIASRAGCRNRTRTRLSNRPLCKRTWEVPQMTTMRRTHCVAMAAGAWLLLACTGLQEMTVPFTPVANAVVIAVALILFATFALVLRFDWSGWATLLIAAWVALALPMLRATQAL